MRSLRARLTFSYALAVALILTVVVIVTGNVTFQFIARSAIDNTRQSADAARRVVAEHPDATPATLERLIMRAAARPGVDIIIVAKSSSSSNVQPPDAEFRPLAPDPFLSRLGLHPEVVPLRDRVILIAPDLQRVGPAVRSYVLYVSIALVVALIGSWLFARWITAQALGPLEMVTVELERFGQGDFSLRPLDTRDRAELGRLAKAYKAAATRVTLAFEERERVEREMRALLGDAGHALRTPLTVISGFVDVLDGVAFDDVRVRERAFRSLRAETRRMRSMVEGLMSLARLEQTEHRVAVAVDVAAAARTVVDEVRLARGGDITLRHAPNGAPEMVLADPDEVHEAISNLVENAVKYGGDGPVSVEVSREANNVVCRVCDRGPGIPEAERSLIFQRFFRGQHSTRAHGSGLGLAIVARAIGRCGGSVRLERSEPGATCFALEMPAAAAPHGRVVRRDAPA